MQEDKYPVTRPKPEEPSIHAPDDQKGQPRTDKIPSPPYPPPRPRPKDGEKIEER